MVVDICLILCLSLVDTLPGYGFTIPRRPGIQRHSDFLGII